MNIIIVLFFSLLFPFAGFLLSLVTKKRKLVLFSTLVLYFAIGLCISLHDPELDSYRYAIEFSELTGGYWSVNDYIINYILGQEKSIMYVIVMGITSSLLPYIKIWFGVWATLYGFFQFKTMELLGTIRVHVKYLYFLSAFVFYMLCPYSNINGVRFFLALLAYFYFTYKYYETHNLNFLWGYIFVFMTHNSFIILMPVPLILHFIRHRRIFGICAIISFIFPLLGITETIITTINSLPLPSISASFDDMLDSYANVQAALERAEIRKEVSPIHNFLNQIAFYFPILFCWIILRCRLYKGRDYTSKLILLFLLFTIFCNITTGIPVVGARFRTMMNLLMVLLIYKEYCRYRIKSLKIMIFLLPIAFSSGIVESYLLMNHAFNWDFLYKPLPMLIKEAIAFKF